MIYVIVQFSCVIYLIINARFDQINIIESTMLLTACLIGLIAVFNMRINNLNVYPELKEKHELRTQGIYKYIRHPMYTSVLLLSFALMLSNANIYAQIVMVILLIDLILKSNVEEKLLLDRFNTYQQYRKTTGRFLPFL